MRIVVTGHNGFVGKYLVASLKDQGHAVTGLSRTEGKDVTKKASFEGLSDFDVLIHLAAQSFVPFSFQQPAVFHYDNFVGTLNAIECCRLNKARFIYLSSFVYGQPKYLPVNEDHPVHPANPYSASKYLGEQLCNAYHHDFNVPVAIIRPFNIYGRGQSSHFLLPTILNQLPSGEIRLQDPRPKRDFIHVMDLVDALVRVLHTPKEYCLYNIGSGVSTSIGNIVEILAGAGMIDGNKVFFANELRHNDVLETVADISKAETELGWSPGKDFKKELLALAEESMTKSSNQLNDGKGSQ